MSTFSLESIRSKLRDFPSPSGIKFPNRICVFRPSIGDFLNFVLDETLSLFQDNRGGNNGYAETASKTVKSIREELCTEAISNYVVCLNDGTLPKYAIPKNGACAVLADGNSTTKGLFERWICGLSSIEEMQTPVSVNVCPGHKFHEIYKSRNRQSQHTSKQILNSKHHLHRGALERILFIHLPDEYKKKCTEKPARLRWLSYIFEIWEDIDLSENCECFFSLIGARNKFTAHQFYEVGQIDFGITEEIAKNICAGIRFYCDVMDECFILIGKNKTFDTLVNSSPLFGIIVLDYICDVPCIIPKINRVTTLAKKIRDNATTLDKYVPAITGGNTDVIRSTTRDIIKLIGRKS